MFGVGSNFLAPSPLSGLASRKVTPAATASSSKSSLQDIVSLSSAAQGERASSSKTSDPKTKKAFKNLKEYMAYVMLVYQKLAKIKPDSATGAVKMEDKAEFTKLSNELKSLKDVDILS